MYSLKSGDRDNSHYLYYLEVDPIQKENALKDFSYYNIQQLIYSPKDIDEKTYDSLVATLSVGDELPYMPISPTEARLAYFTLNVNYTSKNHKITTLNKARTLYDTFNGDYTKVKFIDFNEELKEDISISYRNCLIPGVNIKYEIPFEIYQQSDGQILFGLKENRTYKVLINEEPYILSKKTLLNLINNYKDLYKNIQDIIINTDKYILQDVLEDANFEIKQSDYPFNSTLSVEFIVDNKDMVVWDKPIQESLNWINKQGKYLYNKNKYENIVPFIPKDSSMVIYVK